MYDSVYDFVYVLSVLFVVWILYIRRPRNAKTGMDRFSNVICSADVPYASHNLASAYGNAYKERNQKMS